jgi:hypothetical protein
LYNENPAIAFGYSELHHTSSSKDKKVAKSEFTAYNRGEREDYSDVNMLTNSEYNKSSSFKDGKLRG